MPVYLFDAADSGDGNPGAWILTAGRVRAIYQEGCVTKGLENAGGRPGFSLPPEAYF